MAIKMINLAAETAPSLDDLLIVRDNASGTTRKITIGTLLTSFKYLYSPTGQVSPFAGSAAPDGWLMCDGSPIDRDEYDDLFTVIGTTYGNGNNVDTFNLPDLRGRVPVGKAASGTFQSLNASGGTETETLTIAQIPAHAHGVSDPGHAHGVYDPGHSHGVPWRFIRDVGGGGNLTQTGGGSVWRNLSEVPINASGTGIGIYGNGTGISIQNNGGGASHNNLQPYRVLNYIIKT